MPQYRWQIDPGETVVAVVQTHNDNKATNLLISQLGHHTTNEEMSRLVALDRKSTRLNSSHLVISYAVFCLKKKKNYHISSDSGRPHLRTSRYRPHPPLAPASARLPIDDDAACTSHPEPRHMGLPPT